MGHAVEHLSPADDSRIAVEALLPHLVADHRYRVGVAPEVLSRLEPAAQDRMDSQRLEIVGRHDAARRTLGPLADAEGRPRDPVHDERVEEPAALLEVGEVRPRDIGKAGLRAIRSRDGHQPVLVGHRREWTEQDSFDPTGDRGRGADPQGQAEDRQEGKARTAPEDPESEAEVLEDGIDRRQSPLVAAGFLDLLDAAEGAKRLAPRILGGHAPAQVRLPGHLQVRAQLRVEVVFEMTAAEEPHETVDEHAAGFAHGPASSSPARG